MAPDLVLSGRFEFRRSVIYAILGCETVPNTMASEFRKKPNEVVEGPGVRIERYGRFIRWQTSRTEEEQKKLLEALATYRPKLRQETDEQVKKLESVLAKYDAINMIANFALVNISYDPETYKEYAHEGKQPYVEYICLLYLRKPYEAKEPTPIGKDGIQEVWDAVDKIFDNTILFYATETANPNRVAPPDRLDDLRYRTINYELNVRNPAYYHHELDLLRGLFRPHTEWMEQHLGFNIDDAIDITDSMPELAMEKFGTRRDESDKAAKELHEEIIRYKKSEPVDSQYPRTVVDQLSKMSGKDLTGSVKNMLMGWTFAGLGMVWSTTREELAEKTKINPQKVDAFLDFFSLGFGDIDADFNWPSPTHQLQKKPIIRWDSNYLLPIANLLVQNMRFALESAVKEDSAYWETYQRGRSGYLEEQALQLLSNALGGCEYHLNLSYPKPNSQQGEEAELDGLITFDNVLFLVECRARTMSLPARRGAPSVTEDLKRIVIEAHNQALRAREYVRNAKPPVFRLANGQTLTLDVSKIKQAFLVTVSLDSLSVFTPVLHEVADLSIFNSNELPWAVCLTDLRVISELCEFPSEFIHFLRRRLEINQVKSVHVSDELDWFGHYLAEGLSFESFLLSTASEVRLTTYTVPMDDYYLHEMGVRKTPAKKPSQNILTLMGQVIEWLEIERPHGYSDAVCVLLDMGKKARKQFEQSFHGIRKKAARTKGLHDFTMYSEESKTGLTVVAAATLPIEDLITRLQDTYEQKRRQYSYKRWLFFANQVHPSGLILAMNMIDLSLAQ